LTSASSERIFPPCASDEQEGPGCADSDRREVAQRVVAHVRVEHRIDDQRVDGHQERQAVGGSACDRAGAEVAGRARPVVDDDRLVPERAEVRRQAARERVHPRPRREWNDDMDGPPRPRRLCRCRDRGERRERDGEDQVAPAQRGHSGNRGARAADAGHYGPAFMPVCL
jgi:hypothetical protein